MNLNSSIYQKEQEKDQQASYFLLPQAPPSGENTINPYQFSINNIKFSIDQIKVTDENKDKYNKDELKKDDNDSHRDKNISNQETALNVSLFPQIVISPQQTVLHPTGQSQKQLKQLDGKDRLELKDNKNNNKSASQVQFNSLPLSPNTMDELLNQFEAEMQHVESFLDKIGDGVQKKDEIQ
ncbi:MAG: hypothetical protein EZS28_035969, partial [Streblomastix strix]